jgi:2-iminobutanoate/2-iminopropanoate deaminase
MRTAFLLLLAACAAPKTVSSDRAPKAIGPYSQAIDCGDTVYLAGQIPLDPATGQMVGDTIEAQTEQVLKNLRAVLEASGLTMDHVVKTTVFMTDLKEFPKMNEVYARFFTRNPPARATVQVSALPRGARIEIEAVARR